jgi:lipoprotein-releasing system ATP-binding protein
VNLYPLSENRVQENRPCCIYFLQWIRNYKGNIAINGTQVTGLSQNELAKFRNEQIGFVFQFHFLLPEFTVLDNVMLPALKLNKRTKDEIEAEALESLHLLGLKGNEL